MLFLGGFRGLALGATRATTFYDKGGQRPAVEPPLPVLYAVALGVVGDVKLAVPHYVRVGDEGLTALAVGSPEQGIVILISNSNPRGRGEGRWDRIWDGR